MANDGRAAPLVSNIGDDAHEHTEVIDQKIDQAEEDDDQPLDIDQALIDTNQVPNPGRDQMVTVDVDEPARRLNEADGRENIDEE